MRQGLRREESVRQVKQAMTSVVYSRNKKFISAGSWEKAGRGKGERGYKNCSG